MDFDYEPWLGIDRAAWAKIRPLIEQRRVYLLDLLTAISEEDWQRRVMLRGAATELAEILNMPEYAHRANAAHRASLEESDNATKQRGRWGRDHAHSG